MGQHCNYKMGVVMVTRWGNSIRGHPSRLLRVNPHPMSYVGKAMERGGYLNTGLAPTLYGSARVPKVEVWVDPSYKKIVQVRTWVNSNYKKFNILDEI